MFKNLPFCRYRVFTPEHKAMDVGSCINPQCPQYDQDVTAETCRACVHMHLDDAPPPPPPPSVPRPDLAAIALSLPAVDPIKDAERTFRRPIFHDDGSIEYPREEGSWEPPRDINGYVRDPDNDFLFHPLWLSCGLRHQTAILRPGCGCIDVIMRCNSPQSPEFGARLAHETCAKCPVRVK